MKTRSTETADRILAAAQDLFNRFGEPNVSPAQLAGVLGMSTGNMYYHYPSKADLVNALFERYTRKIKKILPAGIEVENVEDAWFFFHTLFELIGEYRFLYRDLSNLLGNNVQMERQIQTLMKQKVEAIQNTISGLHRHQLLALGKQDNTHVIATSMALLMTYWLNYDYIRAPRTALEPAHAERALLSGAFHVLHLLSPYLRGDARTHLQTLSKAYL